MRHRRFEHHVKADAIVLTNAVKGDQQRIIAQRQFRRRDGGAGRLADKVEDRRADDMLVEQQHQPTALFQMPHETRRAAPGDDLLSQLIAAEEDGERLSRAELISTVILLLNAGHEATVHTLGNASHRVHV